ncbi:MAG TPA: DNA polymerase, partial [Nitrospiraceae bacterium]|nr:DNA polymerase [Nitrospiraceae bacterium]
VTAAMNRGLRDDPTLRAKFAMTLSDEMMAREEWFVKTLGHPLNPRSPLQMKRLFYEDLAQKVIINRKTGAPTLDDDALDTIGKREPLLRPLLRRINEHRSLGVFLSTFVNAKVDVDRRIRCSFNIAGTESFRLSSSQNAFGSGLNLQNVPPGGVTERDNPHALVLPNVRQLFIPDEGCEIFDMDLDRADLQVVVWEADDEELREMLREGVDLHTENARLLGVSRQLAKIWVHGTNYGGGPRTMAINCGLTLHVAEKMQRLWFAAHPGIHRWHRRVEESLRTKRAVANAFGYRRFYFDRIEGILPEALAWIPQSTVARVINGIWWRIAAEAPEIQVLVQVHDSLVGQYARDDSKRMREKLASLSRIVVPYPTPLVIPVGIKTSQNSWGDCK